jgi:hypothetical protein
MIAAIVAGAAFGNGHAVERRPHMLGVIVGTYDCPVNTADAYYRDCKALYVVDVDRASLDDPERETLVLPENARRIGTLPREAVSIAFAEDGRTISFLALRAEGDGEKRTSHLDLWSSDTYGLAQHLLQQDFAADDFFGDPLPVLLGQSRSVRVRQSMFGDEYTSGGSLSSDGRFVAYTRYGLDSQSICLKAPEDALAEGQGVCFGDGFFGDPAWLPSSDR